jgi:hypothetical protein
MLPKLHFKSIDDACIFHFSSQIAPSLRIAQYINQERTSWTFVPFSKLPTRGANALNFLIYCKLGAVSVHIAFT